MSTMSTRALETGFNGDLSVALANNPAGATLNGTIAVQASKGTATFSSLTLNGAGQGYTLQVSGDGPSDAVTQSINVTPASATQLVVTSQPLGPVTAGSAFSLTVAAEDAYGNVNPNVSGSVTVALASNPGGATLSGTLTIPFAAGKAMFTGLTLNKAGAGYVIQATTSGLTATNTTAITVIPCAGDAIGGDLTAAQQRYCRQWIQPHCRHRGPLREH